MAQNNRPPLGEEFLRTTFNLLKKDYKEIIEIEDRTSEGLPQYRTDVTTVVTKRILFDDMSFLTCVEMSNQDGELLQYYYEWYNSSRQLIMKFHAHYHPDEAPEAVKKFDPFHIHKKENEHDLKLTVREANHDLRGIHQIIRFIIQSRYIAKYS